MQQIRKLLKSIQQMSEIGTRDTSLATRDSLRKRIRLVNTLAMISAAFAICSLPFDAQVAPTWMLVQDALSFLLFPLSIYLSHRGHYRTSRIYFLILGNIVILMDALLLGPISGIEMMFFSLAGFGVMLFDLAETRSTLIWSLIPIVEYFYVIGLRPASPESYFIYSSMATFLFVCSSIYFLLRTSDRMEAEVRNSRMATMLSEKMAALGEMSSGIAHEINTPLTILQLNLGLMKRKLEADQAALSSISNYLQKIDKSIVRMTGITRAMQAFSRNAEYDPVLPASMHLIVTDTLELCREQYKNKGVNLIVDPIPESLVFKCRSVQISQVLLNLLSNALQAVEGLNERWVRLAVIEKDSFVRIVVTDSGFGILPEIQAKIFQPFFTTKEYGKGTGLGLSVSKGIVESHEGQIYVDSESSNTEFVVEIPK